MKTFISYSRTNHSQVEQLADDLESIGLEVWLDRELTGGHEWWAEICTQILVCDLFIFALSPFSLKSVPCQSELNYAFQLHKRIVPVLLEEVNANQLSPLLSKIHYVNYRQQTIDNYKNLVRTIGRLPDTRPLPDPLPAVPEIPLPRIGRLRDLAEKPPKLLDDQLRLLNEIEKAIAEDESKQEILAILESLIKHDYLASVTVSRVEKLIIQITQELEAEKQSLWKRVVSWSRLLSGKSAPNKPTFLLPLRPVRNLEHFFWINHAFFSPDMRFVLTDGGDGGNGTLCAAQLWDFQTGESLQTFRVKDSHVTSVAFSPDSQTVLVGSTDKNAYLWHIDSGKLIKRFVDQTYGQVEVTSVSFSPNGKYILTGHSYGIARLWDVDAEKVEAENFIKRFRMGFPKKLEVHSKFSPDGRTILTANGEAVYLWDFNKGEIIKQFDDATRIYSAISFSPDSRSLLLGGSHARLLDIATGEIQMRWNHAEPVTSVAYAPDASMILTGSYDGTFYLWDAQKAHKLKHVKYHSDRITVVNFSPDGRYVLTGTDGFVSIWLVDDLISSPSPRQSP